MTDRSEVINDPKFLPVLDHGFVGIVDYMGSDMAITRAARVSYGKGTRKISDERNLIRYLMRNKHLSPFEQCEIAFHMKMPIFVARQIIRHRTANVNEESARYSVMSNQCYMPDDHQVRKQSLNNKQGRDEEFDEDTTDQILDAIKNSYRYSTDTYTALLGEQSDLDLPITPEEPLARELARMVMPVGAYTEWYWKTDLRNLFNFIGLRADPHAQYEVCVFAEAMYALIKPLFPLACEAFEDYQLYHHSFSKMEMALLLKLFGDSAKEKVDGLINELGGVENVVAEYKISKREWNDFVRKVSSN